MRVAEERGLTKSLICRLSHENVVRIFVSGEDVDKSVS